MDFRSPVHQEVHTLRSPHHVHDASTRWQRIPFLDIFSRWKKLIESPWSPNLLPRGTREQLGSEAPKPLGHSAAQHLALPHQHAPSTTALPNSITTSQSDYNRACGSECRRRRQRVSRTQLQSSGQRPMPRAQRVSSSTKHTGDALKLRVAQAASGYQLAQASNMA